MRQAGVLGAAGILALTDMVDRLAEDHTNAKRLAHGLAEISGIRAQPDTVESNILFFDVVDATGRRQNEMFTHAAAESGVLFSGGDTGMIRAITHYGITSDDVERTLTIARDIVSAR
jgi:threonine aldolase